MTPNGQPRKIPLAVNLDQSALVDMDSSDLLPQKKTSGIPVHDNASNLTVEDWSVGSQPVIDTHGTATNKVGAFAAAAGRGANAFVEAFRSVVSAHRSSYREQRHH